MRKENLIEYKDVFNAVNKYNCELFYNTFRSQNLNNQIFDHYKRYMKLGNILASISRKNYFRILKYYQPFLRAHDILVRKPYVEVNRLIAEYPTMFKLHSESVVILLNNLKRVWNRCRVSIPRFYRSRSLTDSKLKDRNLLSIATEFL